MQHNVKPKNVRLGIQISSDLKARLTQLSGFEGKKISALVRESIEKRMAEIEEKIFVEEMKCAYKGLAEENLKPSMEFQYVDSENL